MSLQQNYSIVQKQKDISKKGGYYNQKVNNTDNQWNSYIKLCTELALRAYEEIKRHHNESMTQKNNLNIHDPQNSH